MTDYGETILSELFSEPRIEVGSIPKLLGALDTACRAKHPNKLLLKPDTTILRY